MGAVRTAGAGQLGVLDWQRGRIARQPETWLSLL